MTIAVIFVPDGHVATYAAQCLDYCAYRGYEVAGLITGNLAAAVAMLTNQTAQVLVVARHVHLGASDGPRIEVVPEQTARPGRGNQRTHLIRRDAAG